MESVKNVGVFAKKVGKEKTVLNLNVKIAMGTENVTHLQVIVFVILVFSEKIVKNILAPIIVLITVHVINFNVYVRKGLKE
jgi:hypothetical protein